jgi:hypothetical protein
MAEKTNGSNDEYLKKVVESASFLSQAIPRSMVTIKNSNRQYVYCTNYWAQRLGASSEEIEGGTYCSAAYHHSGEIEKQILDEDERVITRRTPILVLKISHNPDQLEPYYCLKSPIINPETNDVVGVYCQGFVLAVATYKNIVLQKVGSYDDTNNMALTTREKQVIFLFLSHLNSQEIATILSEFEEKKISKSAIDSVFNEQLYRKFGVHNRPDLHKKLLNLGFSCRIPKEVLTAGSMVLNAIQVY